MTWRQHCSRNFLGGLRALAILICIIPSEEESRKVYIRLVRNSEIQLEICDFQISKLSLFEARVRSLIEQVMAQSTYYLDHPGEKVNTSVYNEKIFLLTEYQGEVSRLGTQ